jgi:hypothetical protein
MPGRVNQYPPKIRGGLMVCFLRTEGDRIRNRGVEFFDRDVQVKLLPLRAVRP